jgi:tetratricopeptide (TPR) repeat protein
VPPGDRREDEVAPTLVADSDDGRGAAGTPTVPASDPPTIKTTEGRLAGGRLGRYEIEYLIGRGGMGEVYAAYDPNLDRPVAVKVLLAGVHGEAHTARLVREAQALARLQHANVVAVYDAGEEDGNVFLAMQYVEGETLAVHLRARPRPWKEVLGLFLSAGRGLAAAHAAGVVHRDFKPSNVMVDRTGLVAVTDFGLARHADDPIEPEARPSDSAITTSSSGRRPVRATADPTTPSTTGRRASRPSRDLTRVGEMIGTPAYMPSEQIAGAEITPATDQFAFCVSVWEALFDQHPYAGKDTDGTPVAFAAALERGELQEPERHPVPKRVVAALGRGLAKDPAQRWPSMDALLAELSRAVRPIHPGWIAAGAGAALVGGAVAVGFAFQGEAPPSCAAVARERVEAVWGPPQQQALKDRFDATDRAYAAATAARIRDAIDAYVKSWTTAAVDACTSSRTGAAEARQRADRRVACLDRAHAALAGTISVFTSELTGDVVDAASGVADNLPPLSDCTTPELGAPPREVAKQVSALELQLNVAYNRSELGQPKLAKELLAGLGPQIAAAGWPPLQVRYDYVLAGNDHALGENRYALFMTSGERAKQLGLHRIELLAASGAMLDAKTQDELDAAVSAGTSAATALGSAEAKLRVSVMNGRGLNRLRKFREAASLCRDGKQTARENSWGLVEDEATTCLVEALVPLGQYGELEGVLAEALDRAMNKLGAEHPTVSSFLEAKADMLANQGKLTEAEALQERVLAIRRRVYGPKDKRIAAALAGLAETATALDDRERARKLLDEALAIATATDPPAYTELWVVERDMGMLAVEDGDMGAAVAHMLAAVDAAAKAYGGESIEVAFLYIMLGQYQTAKNLDEGIATLKKSIAIFEAHGDQRAQVVRGVLGSMLMRFKRYEEAVVLLETAIRYANQRDIPPALFAQMSRDLAEALLALGEKAHARQHAEDAIAAFARANDLSKREYVRDWIRDNKLGDYKSNTELRQMGKEPDHREHAP